MGLNLNHMSASANFKAGDGSAGKSHAMGISGSAYFQPDGKASGDAAKAVVGFPGHPDAAYIFSGSATSDGTGQDKLVVLGDMVISGTINGGGLVNSTGTPLDNQVAIWVDDDTLEGDASFTFDDSTLQVGASTSDAKDFKVFGGSSGKQLLWDASASLLEITGTNGADALYVSDGNVKISDTLDVNGTADFDVSDFNVASSGPIALSGAALTIDATGVLSLDAADDVNLSIATGGSDEKDLTIASTGGGDSSVLISSAGTGADALSLDVSAGSMVVAPSLADGQTLKLGKNGATEMVFTPHGTAANEKISLINTAGEADDAIKIDAVAGGLLLAAGNDSLHLDADGTDADALNIDSAGGMDVDVAGVLNMAAGDDSVIAVTTSAKDLALTVSGGGAQVLQLNSAGTGADAVDINATAGGVTVDAAGAFSVDAVGSSNVTTNGGLVLSGSTGVDVLADSGVIAVTAAKGNIDVDATVGSVSIDGAGGINIGTAADVAIDVDAAAFDLDASGALTIDSATSIAIGTNADKPIDIDSTTLDIDASGAVTIDVAGAGISIDAAAASNLTTSAGALTLGGADGVNIDAGGEVDITTTGAVDINGVGITIDASSGLSLDAGAASNFTTSVGALTLVGAAGESVGTAGQTTALAGSMTVAQNVTITGNLDINGTTTTIDTANMSVQDSIIALGISGSDGSFSNVGDRGIIFARAAAATDALPALKWNGTQFEMGKYLAGPLSQSFGTANSLSGLVLGNLSLPDSDASHFVSVSAASDNLTSNKTLGIRIDDSISGDTAALFISGNLTIESASAINQDVTTDAQVQFSRVAIDGGSNYFDVDGSSNLTATAAGSFVVDAAGDIELNADGADVLFKDGSTQVGRINMASSNVTLKSDVSDADIIFQGNDGGSGITALTLDMSDAGRAVFNDDVRVGVNAEVLGDLIVGAGADEFTISESSDDVTLATGVADKDMIFQVNDGGSATEVMRLDGDVSALLMASGKEIRFADSGEAISGDGTDLTIKSGAKINLTATSDIHVPANVGVVFGTGEKIEGDSTDLTVTSGGDIKLTATSDVELPTNVGLTFDSGAGGMKIEGDSSSNLTVTAGADVKVTPGTGKGLVPSTDSSFDLGNPFRAGSSYIGSGGGRGADNIIANQTINTDASSNSPKALLYTVGSGGIGSAISGASSGLDQSSNLSTSTSSIGWTYGSSISLTAGQLIVAFDGTNYMPFVVLKDFDGNGSSIYVAYHSGVTISGTSLGTSTSSGLTNLYEAGSLSSGGWAVTSPSSISADTVLQIYESGSSDSFALLVANTLSSSSRTPAIVYTKAVTSGYSSWSSAPSTFGSSSNAGGTFDIAWRKLYVDAIDLGGQGIISVGGVGAAGQVGIDLDADDDTSIRSSADDVIDFELGGTDRFQMTTSAFLPGADNSYDLGSASLRYRNIFTGDLNLQNDRGDWTLIEENDFISFRNNQTGRRYRMIMEDITGMGNYGPGNDGEM